jgi:hypothetical protein
MNAQVQKPADVLDQIFAEATAEKGKGVSDSPLSAPGSGTGTGSTSLPGSNSSSSQAWPTAQVKPAIQKVSYNHEALIDLIIANPAASQNALAAHFGLTPSWISQVMSSDAFQSAMAKRREQIVDPILQQTVEQNFKALVSRSLDILQQKLNKPAEEVPDQLALRALEIGSRAAGYGVKEPAAATVQADIHVHLEQLGGGLVALLQRKKLEAHSGSEPIEGDFSHVIPNT